MDSDNFLLFTPGPVEMSENVLNAGSKQLPYFRTCSFSDKIKYCEQNILKMINATKDSKCLFLTSSGTGAMDALMTNLFDQHDNILIVNSGEFGNRFVELALFYNVKFTQIVIVPGKAIKTDDLKHNAKSNFNALLINGHETSTGVLHDLYLTGQFCFENNIMHIVDGISVFLNDELDMQKQNIDILLLSSQKGLALPPGLSLIILSAKAIEKISKTKSKSYYFDLHKYLDNMIRFQTPFTPPIGIIMQLIKRLEDINLNGGPNAEIIKRYQLAKYFRENIKKMPLKIFSERLSNGITALSPTDGRSAYDIVKYFEDNYKIYICPNGKELRNQVFRISHMGEIRKEQIDKLLFNMKKYYNL
ncbi:MAG: aminotransferase class V-fold PLP-dependent enzyme [Bacteroidia bacterium]|nr:aminotransferase class V-fold PLP-dependent enzyme [Bacteroidia bacterium]